MINVWSVSQMLEDSGVLSAEDSKRAMPFCIAACAKLSKRLKDVKYEDEPAVINACAGLAFYDYTLLQSGTSNDFSSFNIGDVTISKSPSAIVENAEKFRDESLLQATDFLKDVDFVFQAVDI